MANEEHLKAVAQGAQGIKLWRDTFFKEWRESPAGKAFEEVLQEATVNPEGQFWQLQDLYAMGTSPKLDLRNADLQGVQLIGADLRLADLSGANLRSAKLWAADLCDASLAGADLAGAYLPDSNLRGTDLKRAKLPRAILHRAELHSARFAEADLTGAELNDSSMRFTDFTGACMVGATLSGARCVGTVFDRADLTRCKVYATAVWDIQTVGTVQHDLVITRDAYRLESAAPPVVTVDDLEIAQFIHLLLNNQKVRQIIDAVTSKVVLILGRFSEPQKAVLDAIRERLRRANLTPVIFDFEAPRSKDETGTVETLARLARFIIADLTDPSSIPHELATVVPFLRTTPVLPLRLAGSGGYSMFADLTRYPWVLKTHEYKDGNSLIEALPEVIAPAERMVADLRKPDVA